MSHPFDDAVHLAWQGGHAFAGHTHPAWANMVGPYGGITAAVAVQALMQHPDCLGEPLALTINYPVAVASGPFELRAVPVRTNRSTQHWTLELVQPHQGELQVMMTATAVTALRRDTWRANDLPMPAAMPPEEAAPIVLFDTVEWVRRYDMRLVQGAIPDVLDDSGQDSLTQLWLRDQPARPLDLPALAAMADAFYPRVWLRRARLVPAGTVSLTIYFHAGSQELAEQGSQYLLGQARAQDFRHGFFDQTAQLWSRSGLLLATAHQIVYYKE